MTYEEWERENWYLLVTFFIIIVLIFIGLFCSLRYVGRLYVKSTGKPVDILKKLNELAGFDSDEEIELYEVCSSVLGQCLIYYIWREIGVSCATLCYVCHLYIFYLLCMWFRKLNLNLVLCVTASTWELHFEWARYISFYRSLCFWGQVFDVVILIKIVLSLLFIFFSI